MKRAPLSWDNQTDGRTDRGTADEGFIELFAAATNATLIIRSIDNYIISYKYR